MDPRNKCDGQGGAVSTRLRAAGIAASLVMAGLAWVAQPAAAGCADMKVLKPVSWQMSGAPSFLKISLNDSAATASSDSESSWNWRWEEEPVRRAPIVGLWAFKYLSKGNLGTLGIPDGAVLDGGNTLWYADGNENTVSGVRAPATGDVCLGVWIRTGEWTYELNHIGLSFGRSRPLRCGLSRVATCCLRMLPKWFSKGSGQRCPERGREGAASHARCVGVAGCRDRGDSSGFVYGRQSGMLWCS